MSWRSQLQPGSFRGAPFFLEAHDAQGGRRLAVHEYPFRDRPFAEDLGARAGEYALDLYVLGADYFTARDRLRDALNAPGPGALVHPYLGPLKVAVHEYRLVESTRNGGVARFSVRFVETAEALYPDAETDTPAGVEAAVESARAAVLADFQAVFDVAGQAQYFVDAVQSEITRVVDTAGDVSLSVAGLIRAPAALGLAIYGGIRDVADALGEPKRALRSYRALFDAGADAKPVPMTTASRRRQAANQSAAHALFRRAAVIEAARQAARAQYDSVAEAQSAEAVVTAGLDAQQEALDTLGRPIADAVYGALAALRAAAVEDLRRRGARLPLIAYHTPAAVLPALVIAHDLYQDAARAAQIVARNNIRHPGFVPGGRPLEVLVDV